ncbi:MAG: hypothetical protein H6660_08640 [Ardenticatenaceae bacterium]|nr:hypothetical protein [Ardenticatenaceae bacterium]
MSRRWALLGTAILFALGMGWMVQTAVAATITTLLYDGNLGTLPAAQGFTYLAFPVQGPTQVISNNGVILDTTGAGSDSAGYFNRTEQTPTLDRSAGYTVTIQAQLLSEMHSSNDRAGFSLIVLSDNLTGTDAAWGIELGFWEDEIWAQEDDTQGGSLFTHAEGMNLETTAAVVQYDLYVVTDTYRLAADGVVVLNGRLRDYSNFSGFPDPYETPNFIFLGDDTSSAAARVQINEVAVTVPASVPPQDPHYVYLPLMIRP